MNALAFRSLSPVSSTKRTTGLSSGRFPITRLAIAPRDSTLSTLSLAMNSRILRSTVAGFPTNGSFLAAALRPHPSSLAIPALKAASALDWGLGRRGMRFRISSVHWYNTDCWLTERPHLGLRYSNHGASAFASQPFLKLLSKSVVQQALYGRGLGRWRRALARLCGRDARAPRKPNRPCKHLMGEG